MARSKVGPIRALRWELVVRRFLREEAERGHVIPDREALAALAYARTAILDAGLVMEGWDAVRMAAAPLSPRPIDQFRRQGSWMMLTAGIALGCEGYAPLEAFAAEMNFERGRMARQYPKVDALAYDDVRRVETTVHRDGNGLRAFTKGDPDSVLACCAQVLDGHGRPLTEEERRQARLSARSMEGYGLETLAFATKWLEAPGDYERDMVFLGVIGMGDLPREEAPGAMDAFRAMGIRPALLSGPPLTEGVARASGALRPDGELLTGAGLDGMNAAALRLAVGEADAFAGLTDAQRTRVLAAQEEDAVLLTAGGSDTVAVTAAKTGERVAVARGGLQGALALFEACDKLYGEYGPDQ